MSYQNRVFTGNDDLPIRSEQPVHKGKVRAVYWLNAADSRRLGAQFNCPDAPNSSLALMVISDRLSAFDCIWRAADGLNGVPGKGAALNAISQHWFDLFSKKGLAGSHIVAVPHPLVWLVRRALPLKIEAIARRYLAGSMARAYQLGGREFCGIALPEGLQNGQKLPELLITPSTKGVLTGIAGVPALDDVNVSRQDLLAHYAAFNFATKADVQHYEHLLQAGFKVIEQALADCGQILVDAKFELGYAKNADGQANLIYMDELGTPDSARLWDSAAYQQGRIVENSKEGFRQFLLKHLPDAAVLLDKQRMRERLQLAQNTVLPAQALLEVSAVYRNIAATITGVKPAISDNARSAIVDVLNDYQLLK